MGEAAEREIRVTLDDDGDAAVVRPGRVSTPQDLNTVLVSRVEALLSQRIGAIVLDMEAVTGLDSMGLGAFVRCHRAVRGAGARVAFARVAPRVHRILSIAMLLQVIPVYDSVADALAALKR